MLFNAILLGLLSYVTGLQPGPQGIYTQSKSSIPTTPGRHDYIQTLEFDPDNTFYLAWNYVCNQPSFCALFLRAPLSGTYNLRKSRSGKLANTYTIKFKPTTGDPFEYKVSYSNYRKEIRVSDASTSYLLVNQKDKCQFHRNNDYCEISINSNTQCASDNKCRIIGRLNTSCETDDNCNDMYQCRNSVCRK